MYEDAVLIAEQINPGFFGTGNHDRRTSCMEGSTGMGERASQHLLAPSAAAPVG